MLKMFNYLKMLKQVSYLNMYVGRRGRTIMTVGFGLIYLAWVFNFYIYVTVFIAFLQ